MIRLFYLVYLGQTIHRVFTFLTRTLRLFYLVYLDKPRTLALFPAHRL